MVYATNDKNALKHTTQNTQLSKLYWEEFGLEISIEIWRFQTRLNRS
jgi:hypothetical protein